MKMRRVALLFVIALCASVAAQAVPKRGSAAAASRKLSATELQVALDRAGFSPGEIDGKAGGNTRKAVAFFQKANDLPSTGVVDGKTRAKLFEVLPGDALGTYTITAEDADGPFIEAVPDDMMEKAALPALAYTSTLELLGERFHTKPELLRRLNPGSRFAAGERIRVPDVLTDERDDKAARVTVSKSRSIAVAVDDSGRTIFFAPITAGSARDPLPIGEWKVKGISENPTFHYNPDLFWDADESHAKAKIPAGPNNPVGVVWIDIDKEHYGLHGTDKPSKVGHAESHGCVRLTNWDARRLAHLVQPGTPMLFVK
jgi:lipoprotein-anchoring transpeptidase ErfK/SrfK